MSDYIFSPSRVAFYPLSLRGEYDAVGAWPEDGVPVSAEGHARILLEQEAGRVICADRDGQPMTQQPPPPSVEALAAVERAWRDRQLDDTDALVVRHRDEIEDGATTLTDEQYQTLQTYRRALRDWPESERFPQSEYRPARPEWLLGALSKR
ncbi:phage tail assembly chaperone [Pseudomonas aeruginosa]|uniref:phage tail assembly chaperone n=1 Tax=Pseudomonas aeruginosa TaxID=287 RepID=UPI002935AE4D|nr:phage tail assembly chaperone [Pseudomonas aeruginosa]MDV2789867.1 phage tail assembly chaperone [Pseudomonas aeruginosa]